MSGFTFNWTNESLTLLIKSYRSFECLWNPKDPKYNCRNTKQDAWMKLSEISGANEAEVKRKMKNLISQFFRERKKCGSFKKSGSGAYFVSKWFAYNDMLFLVDKYETRRCNENGLNEIVEKIEIEEDNLLEKSGFSDTNSMNLSDNAGGFPTFANLLQKSQIGFTEDAIPGNDELEDVKPPLEKRTKVCQDGEVRVRVEEAFLTLKSSDRVKDECDLYAELLAIKLRKLDERTRDIAMNKIDNLLFQMKMSPNLG